MPAIRKCRGCGTDVPVNAPFGHCPKCLLDLGFGPMPDEDAPFKSGSTRPFGEYELLEQIGRGGMGIVYKARQVALNRLVALKMVSAGELASPILIQRFHREAEAAANLHHPNIVPIYETGEHQGQHFFSMELIEGTSLDRHIGRGGFNLGDPQGDARAVLRARQQQIARILAKVARAVDYAHQHGVLHRDLKPSNVILDASGEPHLTDFGVAKVLGQGDSSLTASGAIMGTPSYMAPEQAAGQSKRITTAADTYSLGAILYAMLTGVPPFRGETPVETLRQVIEDEPKHPSTLKDGMDCDLATIAMKCLEKEPHRRYASAAALADELERWLRKEPIHARPAGTGERFWRWCRRNPKVATLGGSVALLLIFLAVGATAIAVRIKAMNDDMERKKNDIERKNQELQAANAAKDSAYRHLLKEVLDDLVKVYEDPDTKSSVIYSGVRRGLYGEGQGRVLPGPPLELTFVEDVYEHPTNMLATLSPIFRALEDNLSDVLGKPVAIHMQMCKSSDTRNQALESTNFTFSRVGPVGYVNLLDKSNGVRLLAMQDHKNPLTMAIFTRTDSDIARLADLANRSFAFSGSNSTTGTIVPKWFLATNGIFATNLAHYAHHDGQRRVFDAVMTKSFDAGSGNLELLDKYPALRVIATNVVQDLGRCWTAGKGLDSVTEARLRECLLKLRGQEILGGLESETTGFKMINAEALDRLRKIIRGAAAFDAGRSPGAP